MQNSNVIRVLSVESNAESNVALKSSLAAIADLQHASASTASEALTKLKDESIDVAVIDLALPEINGIELTKQIRQSHPSVRVLMFTASDSPEDIFAAMDAGADGYLLKGNLSEALEIAIRSVRLGAVWLDPSIARQVLRAIETASTGNSSRILQTGLMTIPIMPDEESLLNDVAGSNCVDGVCMIDPSFLRRLRRFSPSAHKH